MRPFRTLAQLAIILTSVSIGAPVRESSVLKLIGSDLFVFPPSGFSN